MRILDLGPLAAIVEADGATQRIVGAKQVAVLSILCAAAGARVSLDALAEAGWGQDATVTAASIENQIWRLRKTLGLGRSAASSALLHDQGGYRLDLAAGDVDSRLFVSIVEAAREAARAADYPGALLRCEEALALWRGDPFEAIAHTQLAEQAIARLAELRAQVREWRIDALLALGETDQAILDSEQLVREYPYRERLWAQRMTGLSRQGRNQEALLVYAEARTLLLDELGLDPGRELRDLQRAIIAQGDEDVTPDSGPDAASNEPAAAPNGTSARPLGALIGRAAERSVLTAAIGVGDSVVIDAVSGVGRTRMLEEARVLAEQSGADVVWIVGTRSGAAVPLAVFADLLPPDARSDDLLELLQRCSATLLAHAGERQLILCVDDAHLLDAPSAALMLHVASTRRASVIATVRSGEPVPDAVRALQRQEHVRRITLGPLAREETALLAATALRGPIEPAVGHWLFRISQGNAFHAIELAGAAQRDGTVLLEHGRWVLGDVPHVPASLAELVRDALDDLGPHMRRAVEVLSFAEPMRLSDLVAIVGAEIPDELEQSGLIALQGSGRTLRALIAHPLYGAVLRETLPPVRAHRIRRELIALYADRHAPTIDERLRLARWRLDTGEIDDTADLVAVAGLALISNDPAFALELIEAAEVESADESDGSTVSVAVDGRLVRARAHVLRREYAEASAVLEGLEPSLRTRDQAITYLEAQTEITRFGRFALQSVPAMFERARRWWPDPDWVQAVDQLHDRDGVFESLLGSDVVDRPGARASTRVGALFYSGRSADALALALQTAEPPPFLDLDQALYASVGARVELERGDDLASLETRLETMRSVGLDVGDPGAVGIAAYELAEVWMLRAEPVKALDLFGEARRYLTRRDPVALLAAAWAGTTIAALDVGDQRAADEAIGSLRITVGDDVAAHLIPYAARAEAAFAAADERIDDAVRILAEAAEQLVASPIHRAHLTYDRILLGTGVDEQQAELLRRAAEECDAPLVGYYAHHASAVVEGDGTSLLRLAGILQEKGLVRYVARVRADAASLGRRDAR